MNSLSKVAACAAIMIGMAGQADADLVATVTFNANLTSGSDTPGLNGSTITFVTSYDQNGLYVNKLSFPAINALQNSLTIAGASVAGTNGVYSSTNGIALFPTFVGQYFNNSGSIVRFLVSGGEFRFNNLIQNVPGVTIGSTISPSDFGSVGVSYNLLSFSDGSQYEVSGLSVIVTTSSAVPEPSSVALGGMGVACVAAARWRRRRSA